jgi:hypothetical protein
MASKQSQSSGDPSKASGGSKSQTSDGTSDTTGVEQSFDDTPNPNVSDNSDQGYRQPGSVQRDRSLDGTSPHPQGFGRPSAPTDEDRAARKQAQAPADTEPHDTEQR